MHKTRIVKTIFLGLGTISLGLAVLGIFLPLVPTTPLVLLSAALYAKGSDKMYQWLIDHKWFGPQIKQYQSGNGIPRKAKVMAITMTWAGLLFSAYLISAKPWLLAIIYFVGVGITAYMLSLPTYNNNSNTSFKAFD